MARSIWLIPSAPLLASIVGLRAQRDRDVAPRAVGAVDGERDGLARVTAQIVEHGRRR